MLMKQNVNNDVTKDSPIYLGMLVNSGLEDSHIKRVGMLFGKF